MRPIRSFLIILIFLACFAGFHYIVPVERYFPPMEEFLPDYIVNFFNLSENKPDNQSVVLPCKTHILSEVSSDTLLSVDLLIAGRDTIPITPLQGILDSLSDSSGQTRIMYYGDSQIEGDRFSSYLRHTLQKRYSGTGPGLFLPLIPVMYTKSIVIKSSSNWKKYNYLSYRNNEISHNRLGPFMAICRYLPEGEISAYPLTASVNIRPSVFADSASSVYEVLRLFYMCREGEVALTVRADGRDACRETLLKTSSLKEVSCLLNGAKDITLEFTGKVSPEIFGISIESSRGVIVDNIPQRGSAGLEFTMVDSSNLAESIRMISPDLFILQYGLNIVRNVRGEYSFYQQGLKRQISLLKKIAPSIPVLVISVTDMASDEEGVIKSFGNIPAIIAAQKEAAEETGAVFWDSYKAMGGDSSIIRWSKKKPALSQKDYVHFTYTGADTLSRLFTNDIFPFITNDSSVNSLTAARLKDTCEADSLSLIRSVETRSITEKIVSDIIRYDPDKPMIFTTPAFWLFLLFVLAGYSLIYRRKFLRNFYLFLVSLFFYYKSGGLLLVLLLLIIIVDYTCGLLIHNSEKRFSRRFFILLSVLSNIGLLAYFKYTGFFVETANYVFGTDIHVHDYLASLSNNILGTTFDISNIILPVGISFFTFQSLSYTIDVYRKKMEPVRNIIDFSFYVSFFPQLVAGPIVRASEFIPQLYKEFSLSKREFSHALFLISKGLIKKIIISDFIAVNFVDRVFDAPAIYSGFENLMAVYGYGLQIYCDFSGYTDIAIGLGLVFGFRFPINFNSPYKAADLTDFWKRWHISLSRWLKDYLYIPLGGNRKGRIRTNFNLMFTMLVGGLWHGAALRFVIWGALHGTGLVINRIWISITGNRFLKGRAGRVAGILITFNFVSFCWIFFRAPDLDSVMIMLNQITFSFSPGSYLAVLPAYSNVFLLMIAAYLIHFLSEDVKESYRGLFIRIPLILQMFIIMLIAVLLFQMRSTEVMPFIYFRF